MTKCAFFLMVGMEWSDVVCDSRKVFVSSAQIYWCEDYLWGWLYSLACWLKYRNLYRFSFDIYTSCAYDVTSQYFDEKCEISFG